MLAISTELVARARAGVIFGIYIVNGTLRTCELDEVLSRLHRLQLSKGASSFIKADGLREHLRLYYGHTDVSQHVLLLVV
jgi:hypothetical protein